MVSDIEIARSVKLEHITKIAAKYGMTEDDIELYGKYKAKVSNEFIQKVQKEKDAKLVLVTAINPTPLGEGKTTVAIGLSDGLNRIGKKSVLALREPSLGPVFGVKGGATGGGHAQVAPMEDINLHFTGDIHAITSANNLLSAMIDNHIYYGNALGFKKVIWKRCVDLNDRALREVEIGLSKEKNMVPRPDGFDISVASEIMAIFCLSKDIEDLERRLGNIIVGYNNDDKPIFAKDLKAEGALTVLLKDAINPNIVQTLEHNLAVVHGGPFANIAHGCNSVIATKLALKLGDYVITEAGFGADLGAEKFVNVKCRKAGLKPTVAVCVATLKALKYHGGVKADVCSEENIEALAIGIENLKRHVENIKDRYGLMPIVAINRYQNDTEKELKFLEEELKKIGVELSLTEVWAKGGEGAIDLAEKVVKLAEGESKINFVYKDEESIKDKILKVAKEVYGAEGVEYTDNAIEEIEQIEKLGYGNYPVCIAKTQYSFSDDAKNLLCDKPFKITIKEAIVKNGAEFVVIKTGKIFTMPGLPRVPAAESIRIDDNGDIEGIF
ncbi:MAG: formate--tetrahydrofolate ligase [Clostridia bacterium]|nr:formate--tetrahydrofolate ligase [Clostridia bacterium]